MKRVVALSAGGTYRITHAASGRSYAGQTINLASRFSYHRTRLACGLHHNRLLQLDWNQYGAEAFTFEVVSRFADEYDRSRRHSEERALIAANGPALSYNLLSADERRRDGSGALLVTRALKLSAEHWQAFDDAGGMEWLRNLIERTKGG